MSLNPAAPLLNAVAQFQELATLKREVFQHLLAQMKYTTNLYSAEPDDPDARTKALLNSFGPSAAKAAVEYSLNVCQSRGLTVNNAGTDFVTNSRLALAAGGDIRREFTTNLEQFLIPRTGGFAFDTLVDPRHAVNLECGYPSYITPAMYRYMYDRDDMASRVNDIFPDESWAMDPDVYELEDETEDTDFELGWKALCDGKHQLLQHLYRLDKLAGIGHYGIMLIGLDDKRDLAEPVEGITDDGELDPQASKQPRKLLYLRSFDEYLVFISKYETDTNSPRHGLPLEYDVTFADLAQDSAGGAAFGSNVSRKVHWTRVVHVPDNALGSPVFGVPRQKQVFNRLLDLRKIKGATGEMIWKGGYPGIAFEVDPKFVSGADVIEFDREAFKETIQKYSEGLQKYIDLIGVKANALTSTITDSPDKYVKIQVDAIASAKGIPTRIFMGSEEAKLASSEDKLTWNQRLGRRNNKFVTPTIVRPVAQRLIACRVLPPLRKPDKLFVEWPDLNMPTFEDKANLSLKWTQALSQYVASGTIHLVPPMDYLTLILGLKPSAAKRIIAAVENKGGWSKLMSVDPSQGAGVNGVRQKAVGVAGAARKPRTKAAPTATKSADGMKS